MRHPSRRQAGFTLLEILVAFVMLALVGGALLQLFQGGLQNLAAGDSYGRAALLAESTLSQLRAESTLATGQRSGELEPGYRYELQLTPYQEEGEVQPDLLQADLTILWGTADNDRHYSVRTLLLPPGGTR
jgi:general secretion pathway protein I